MDEQPLPRPVTTPEEYAYHMVLELRRLNGLMAELVRALAAPGAGDGDTVKLREPAKGKGKPKIYQDVSE